MDYNKELQDNNAELQEILNTVNELDEGGVSGDYILVPETAAVGQTVAVKAVDENGKPIEWEAVDFPEDGADGVGISSVYLVGTSTIVNQYGQSIKQSRYVMAFTDGNTFEFVVSDGASGADGENGADGSKYLGNTLKESTDEGNTYQMMFRDMVGGGILMGEFTAPRGLQGEPGANGADGKDGADGENGHTPVKGVDYWTAADRQAMVDDVIAALPVYNGEVEDI